MEEKIKKEKLSKLQDEVKQFHPLLNKLLPKLNRVKKVEYTHGPQEKGADFVLIREDDTLISEEYIGVIAKTGKIHQDLSKIEQQIDECDAERYILGGKKKIRLDEIWIATNEHISSNAKEKIHRKFSTRKIKFIQNVELINLIDTHLSNYWFEIPVEIGDFLLGVTKRVSNLNTNLNLLPSMKDEFYIEQDLEEIDWEFALSKKKKNKIVKYSKVVEIITNNKISFIEGGSGFGKSKLVRHSVSFLCEPTNYIKHRLIPILLSYRDFVEIYNESYDDVLNKVVGNNAKEDFMAEAEFIIFLDGFDEKIYDDDEEYQKLNTLISSIKERDKLRLVITSRPLHITELSKLKSLNIAWYEILPLTLTRILEFFDKLCKKTQLSNRIVEDIKKSHLFKQLPKSPIATILLANLLNENSRELPSNLTELYLKYSELMLGRWDIAKGLQSEKEYEAAKFIIMNISKYFIDNDLSYMAIDEVLGFFSDYLDQRNLDISSKLLFEKITCRSGILQKEEQLNRVYFKHRTFAEFFYAMHMDKSANYDFVSEKIYDSYWRNIFFFFVGLKKDCEDIINKMLSVPADGELRKLSRIINMSDYLLAAYATPYRVVKGNFHKIVIETVELYLDIINRNHISPIQTLPEIAILYLFQSILRHSYSYEFFEYAFDDAVINILSDSSLDDNKKIYSLYFISVILIELELPNPFDGLLEKYKDELPLVVQFAIEYDLKNIKHYSSLLRKQEKKLKKTLKNANPELKSYIKNIHSLPVKQLKS